MAKKSAVVKNLKRIKLSDLHYEKRKALKEIIMDKNTSMTDKLKAQIKLNNYPRDGSRSRVRNRCVLTGRPRGYYGDFGLSRIAVRRNASFGLLPGIIKSSW